MAVLANTNTQNNALLPPCTFDEMLPELCRYLNREEGPLKDCTRCRIALAEMVPDESGHDSIAAEGLGLGSDDKDQEITRADGDEQGGDDADANGVATEEPSRTGHTSPASGGARGNGQQGSLSSTPKRHRIDTEDLMASVSLSEIVGKLYFVLSQPNKRGFCFNSCTTRWDVRNRAIKCT